jgi:2-phosphosulfolactate phosphatase
MSGTFVIDFLPESAQHYVSDCAIAAVDVIRATTMAITAVALGHRCYTVTSVDEAFALARTLDNRLLAGELKGVMPAGFDMNNSPAELTLRSESERPLILLSSSGTQLLHAAGSCAYVYVACLRNCYAVSRHMAARHPRIALIGAGSRGEFREEDQLCCGWMGKYLMDAGYVPENKSTADIVERWYEEPVAACAIGHSAMYLQRTGQLDDLDFVLEHVNDLPEVYLMDGREVVGAASRETANTSESGLVATGY